MSEVIGRGEPAGPGLGKKKSSNWLLLWEIEKLLFKFLQYNYL